MVSNQKEYFCTDELHQLHPELTVRDDKYNGEDYVVFRNPEKTVDNVAPEWPIGLELWVEHEHERNVDGNIFGPLRFYADRRGLTEALTGTVYGEIATMTEILTQHLYGGYAVDVMFGVFTRLSDSQRCFLVKTPSDIELELDGESIPTPCVLIRILNDTRLCAINSTANEPCTFLYHCIQYATDGFRRYEFLLYPLLGAYHSARAQTITAKDYVHFYAAMYESCIMLAHHERAQDRQS